MQLNPDDPSSLIERAACHVGLQQFEEALEDTNKALKMKNYLRRLPCKGLYIKGDALYNLGNFEHALVFYYRALKRSASNNEEEAVRNRISRATKAIDNAIGIKASRHFMAMPAVLNKYITRAKLFFIKIIFIIISEFLRRFLGCHGMNYERIIVKMLNRK